MAFLFLTNIHLYKYMYIHVSWPVRRFTLHGFILLGGLYLDVSFDLNRIPSSHSGTRRRKDWSTLVPIAIWQSSGDADETVCGIPFRERSHIPPMGKDTHLPNCLWMGYVSSLEGRIFPTQIIARFFFNKKVSPLPTSPEKIIDLWKKDLLLASPTASICKHGFLLNWSINNRDQIWGAGGRLIWVILKRHHFSSSPVLHLGLI